MTAETMPAVTDADREAGAQIAALQELREMILAGEADDSSPVHIAVKIRREALEAGKLEGARLMQEAAAIHAICAFDDRNRSRHANIDWNDGHLDGTRDAAANIRALDFATVLRNAVGGEA